MKDKLKEQIGDKGRINEQIACLWRYCLYLTEKRQKIMVAYWEKIGYIV